MSRSKLDATLQELGVPAFIKRAGQTALARSIAYEVNPDIEQPNPERLPRLAFTYETQAIAAYQREQARKKPEKEPESRSYFDNAFMCWRSLLNLSTSQNGHDGTHVPAQAITIVSQELRGEPISPHLTLAFRLAVSGLHAEKPAETRFELKRFSLDKTETDDWKALVTDNIFSAFVRFTRKAGGWEDIDRALESIQSLRRLQSEFEDRYLNSLMGEDKQTRAAIELVGLYHLAQFLTLTGDYLRDGEDSITKVNTQLDRHRDRATTAFETARSQLYLHLANLLWVGCRKLTHNSIWTHVPSLGEAAQRFARLLSEHGRPNPVLELWPSQQEAFRKNLLDPYRRAILVEMPTSAGKTLLAKFAIVQTRALNPNGTIAYIVPTRALVNQVTLDLRSDFVGLDIRVEQAVPAFELDPTEDQLLQQAPNILVTTPEKLDFLVRKDHVAVRELSLVIADEAHNIADSSRGPRLELLLGTIKRDKAGARFLLLSPFMPGNQELVLWLGEDRALDPIIVNWRPSRRMVGGVRFRSKKGQKNLFFETLDAADNADVAEGFKILLSPGTDDEKDTVGNITGSSVRALKSRGSVLVLCTGPGTAMKRARQIAGDLPARPRALLVDSVCRFINAELGYNSGLGDCLERGVAYHHAGLSFESRFLIEQLIKLKHVDVICGTTTLAQGVNFPITTVIVETLKKGDTDLTYQDFWNIAGRAGRTLIDSLGVVAFPINTASKLRKVEEFLKGESTEIASQLATLLTQIDAIGERFTVQVMSRFPQLSALLQFLAHAMRVSDNDNLADEVEDLLRDSLIYHQVRDRDDEGLRRLMQISRAYLESIKGNKGFLALADQTGFATPSVLKVLGATRGDTELNTPENWAPKRLFGDDIDPLLHRIQAIAELPEINLGAGETPPFDARRVAGIIRDWVNGRSLKELADEHFPTAAPGGDDEDEEAGGADEETRVSNFSRYLFGKLLGRASWGIGALEGICLAGREAGQEDDIAYVPSMVFFGVKKKEAIWLRMVGVPRIAAEGLGSLWQQQLGEPPNSYDGIRNWVSGLSDDEWRGSIPPHSGLTSDDMRLLWRTFAG